MWIECLKGHRYESESALPPKSWPVGAPRCPICCKVWIANHPTWSKTRKFMEMSKIKQIMEKTYGGKGERINLIVLPVVKRD